MNNARYMYCLISSISLFEASAHSALVFISQFKPLIIGFRFCRRQTFTFVIWTKGFPLFSKSAHNFFSSERI